MAKKPTLSASSLGETQKAELYAKLGEWHKAKLKAAEWSAKEMELRRELVSTYFPNGTEGTNNMTLDFGKVLKANITISRSPDKAQLNALLSIERAKPEGSSNILPLLDDVIVYKPEVSVSAWKELTDDQRKLLADVVTEKPGAPSLSIETPKT